jgi:hypothetical protein
VETGLEQWRKSATILRMNNNKRYADELAAVIDSDEAGALLGSRRRTSKAVCPRRTLAAKR